MSERTDASTQRLAVRTHSSGAGLVDVLDLDVPTDFVDLRLIVDPAGDSFNVMVAGVDRGTYAYERLPQFGAPATTACRD